MSKCHLCRCHVDPGTGYQTPLRLFCGIDCAIASALADQDKIRQRQEKKKAVAVRVQHKADKERIKKAGDYIKEAQAAVNRYVRARDYGKPCISCGSMPEQKRGGTMDAGHYRSRGAASHLRFNVFNISSQCVKCNRYNSGNAVDFRIELIKRIGPDRVDRLENDNDPRKFTIDYLKRIKKIFSKRARIQEKRNRQKQELL